METRRGFLERSLGLLALVGLGARAAKGDVLTPVGRVNHFKPIELGPYDSIQFTVNCQGGRVRVKGIIYETVDADARLV